MWDISSKEGPWRAAWAWAIEWRRHFFGQAIDFLGSSSRLRNTCPLKYILLQTNWNILVPFGLKFGIKISRHREKKILKNFPAKLATATKVAVTMGGCKHTTYKKTFTSKNWESYPNFFLLSLSWPLYTEKNTAIAIRISTRVYIQSLSSNGLILVEIFKVDGGWVLSDVRQY